jgi:hypothetical protein
MVNSLISNITKWDKKRKLNRLLKEIKITLKLGISCDNKSLDKVSTYLKAFKKKYLPEEYNEEQEKLNNLKAKEFFKEFLENFEKMKNKKIENALRFQDIIVESVPLGEVIETIKNISDIAKKFKCEKPKELEFGQIFNIDYCELLKLSTKDIVLLQDNGYFQEMDLIGMKREIDEEGGDIPEGCERTIIRTIQVQEWKLIDKLLKIIKKEKY